MFIPFFLNISSTLIYISFGSFIPFFQKSLINPNLGDVYFTAQQLSKNDLEVIMSTTKKDKIIIATIKELLPLAFGPKDLKIDVKKFSKVK